jgi:hypothetical protein
LESVLAGGNGDGGIQLRPDGGGASSSAGEKLAVATAGGGNGGAAPVPDGDGLKIYHIRSLYSAFFSIRPFHSLYR